MTAIAPGGIHAAGKPLARLTFLYVAALSTVALLSVGAQWLIQNQLSQSQGESLVINLAGRQRMLSQRLAKAALALRGEAAPAAAQELRETLDDWVRHHRGLVEGAREIGLEGNLTPTVAERFQEVQPAFERIRDAAQTLVQESPRVDSDAVAAILANEMRFLTGMDRVVSQLVDEAERRVARLRQLESLILGLTLLVLLAEGLFIFRPAAARVEKTLEDLRAAKAEADRANAAKTRFLANVSHELRTPMTAVLGMTELALDTSDEQQRRRHLRTVTQAGESLLALLNDLIDVAGIDADVLTLRPQPFSPADLVQRVGRLLGPSAECKGLAVVATAGASAQRWVLGDVRRLEQVLLNLVSNAVKWTDEGRVTLRCDAESVAADRLAVRFTVSDTGPGVDPSDLPRLFEPFIQGADPSGRTRGGVGLGLAIVKRIADAMGLSVELHSAPDQGFTAALAGVFPVTEAPAKIPVGRLPKVAGLNVLVVEDTPFIQELLEQMLTPLGCRVALARSVAEAVSRDFYGVDVALIDRRLPDGDGLEVAAAIRAAATSEGRPAPRLVCTTASPTALADPLVEAAFDSVMAKPFDRRRLLQELKVDATATSTLERDQELVQTFLNSLPKDVTMIDQALRDQRLQDAGVVAHRIAGQVGYFGASRLRSRLLDCEQSFAESDAGDAADLWRSCSQELTRLAESLRERCEIGHAT